MNGIHSSAQTRIGDRCACVYHQESSKRGNVAFMPSVQSRSGVFFYANFDLSALCNLASKIRQGQDCACDPTQMPMGGGFHWVVPVTFKDGVQWIFRSPYPRDPLETRSVILASEVATLNYIGSNSDVPVPEVYAYRQVTIFACSIIDMLMVPQLL